MKFEVQLLSSVNTPTQNAHSLVVTSDRTVVIGRDRDATATGEHSEGKLRFPQKSLSRTHGKFLIDDGKLAYMDLSSKNGSMINGVRADPLSPYVLAPDHELKLGLNNSPLVLTVDRVILVDEDNRSGVAATGEYPSFGDEKNANETLGPSVRFSPPVEMNGNYNDEHVSEDGDVGADVEADFSALKEDLKESDFDDNSDEETNAMLDLDLDEVDDDEDEIFVISEASTSPIAENDISSLPPRSDIKDAVVEQAGEVSRIAKELAERFAPNVLPKKDELDDESEDDDDDDDDYSSEDDDREVEQAHFGGFASASSSSGSDFDGSSSSVSDLSSDEEQAWNQVKPAMTVLGKRSRIESDEDSSEESSEDEGDNSTLPSSIASKDEDKQEVEHGRPSKVRLVVKEGLKYLAVAAVGSIGTLAALIATAPDQGHMM